MPKPPAQARAVLTYWGSDGYFTEPHYCAHGGAFFAHRKRTWGDAKGYRHALYDFEAKSKAPDDCAFTAILNDTGSPPIAVLKLRIR